MKYALRFDGPSAPVLKALGLGPRFSTVDVSDHSLDVRMGWAFRATIPRTNITSVTTTQRRTFSRGVHGWRGRWLVNGSGHGLVTLTIEPAVRAHTIGVPVRLRELTVSVDAPAELVEALAVG